jgi:hypothetical protein
MACGKRKSRGAKCPTLEEALGHEKRLEEEHPSLEEAMWQWKHLFGQRRSLDEKSLTSREHFSCLIMCLSPSRMDVLHKKPFIDY